MPTINYKLPDGTQTVVDVPLGSSVMQGAVDNLIQGILAECGGACSCATCRVDVESAWMERVGEACDMEREMMDAGGQAGPNSRLSCQIEITPELEGLVVCIPEAQ